MTIKAKLGNVFTIYLLSDFLCVDELKNNRTSGYGMETARRGQDRNDPEKKDKQRAGNFKEIKSSWENFFAGKQSDCKTTQMQQKEKIDSKQLSKITSSGETYSGHVTDRKTFNIDTIFKDDESICSGLDRSQNMNASEIPKTKTTISPLQNESRIGRQPKERPEITSNMNMLHGGNQFESTLRRLYLHETLCLR